jgi:hypothetical protein
MLDFEPFFAFICADKIREREEAFLRAKAVLRAASAPTPFADFKSWAQLLDLVVIDHAH